MTSFEKALVLFLLTLSIVPLADALENETQEQIQAAMVFHLFNFVQWPEKHTAHETHRICMLPNLQAQASFAGLEGVVAKSKPIHVQTCETGACAQDCDILLVSQEEERTGKILLDAVAQNPVLTLSIDDGALAAETMISFYNENGRLRMSTHLSKVLKRGFSISARMLRLMRIVDTEAAIHGAR